MIAPNPDKKLFEWQRECLQRWLESGAKGIVNVVTGAGKTYLATEAIRLMRERSSKPLKVKIIVPKVFLCEQWRKALIDDLGAQRHQIGIYNGSIKSDIQSDYMIYVVNSARYNLSRHILSDAENGHSIFLICDECHHYASEENAKIFEFIPLLKTAETEFFSLGLSATPEGPNYRKTLIPALGNEIYKYDLASATKAKISAEHIIFHVEVSFSNRESAEYLDYSDRIAIILRKLKKKKLINDKMSQAELLEALKRIAANPGGELARALLSLMFLRRSIVYNAQNRIFCCETIIKLLDSKSRIIVFGERIDSIELLYIRLKKKYPGQVGRYHSDMSSEAKRRALESYKSGETRVLLSCRALDEGLNVPETDIGIILSSTGSSRQRIQRTGRVLRQSFAGGVKKLYYIYVGDSNEDEKLIIDGSQSVAPIRKLYYSHEKGCFIDDEYDQVLTELISAAQQSNYPEPIIMEFRRNLDLGIVSGDWLIPKEQLLANAASATAKDKRNYWIAMYKAAEQIAGAGATPVPDTP